MRPFQPIQENLVTPGFELYCLGREAVGIVLARAAAGDARVVKARLCRLGETGSPFRIAGARSKHSFATHISDIRLNRPVGPRLKPTAQATV
jgi:hypothetical protein